MTTEIFTGNQVWQMILTSYFADELCSHNYLGASFPDSIPSTLSCVYTASRVAVAVPEMPSLRRLLRYGTARKLT